MDPSMTGAWPEDATVEEVIHTINAIGHSAVYPGAFSIDPNSSLLTQAMDSARGGQFVSHPGTYPSDAWYHYEDVTCDYGCMAIEYLYWMEVSNMGILDDPSTCSGIANEWQPCSQALLMSMDTLGYNLITDPAYKLPQNAPDGNYCPAGMSIEEGAQSNFRLYPNPASSYIHIDCGNASQVDLAIVNMLGETVLVNSFVSTTDINVSDLSSGIYFVQVGSHSKKLIIP